MRAVTITIAVTAAILAPIPLSYELREDDPYERTPPVEEAHEVVQYPQHDDDTSNAICTSDCPLVEPGHNPWEGIE